MTNKGKRIKNILKEVDVSKHYFLEEAIEILKQCPSVKFDQTVEVSLKIGVDPKKTDQQVRGAVFLPHGTGKKLRILVFTSGVRVQEALNNGADYAGNDDLLAKVSGGWVDFDVVVATPDMMREVGKLGKVLGPRGLMPTPKAGTVTNDIVKAIQELKKGKIEFKLDRNGLCNSGIAKLSFSSSSILENIKAYVSAIAKAKPAAAKGQYFLGFTLSSTMGPGLKIDLKEVHFA